MLCRNVWNCIYQTTDPQASVTVFFIFSFPVIVWYQGLHTYQVYWLVHATTNQYCFSDTTSTGQVA